MKKHKGPSARRRFLKTGTLGAFALLGGKPVYARLVGNLVTGPGNVPESREAYRVFSEGQIGSLTLNNRLVRAAAFLGMSSRGGLNEVGLATYRAYAEGGVGMVISGNMYVMKPRNEPGEYFHNPINSDSCIPEIKRMADAVHRVGNGCKIIAQINHPGMQYGIAHPVSPSGIWLGISSQPDKEFHVLSTEETELIVKDFVLAGERAQKAGFDGVELHGAHGYLLSSFLSPYSNRREDKYGGSHEQRATIIREIVSGIRERTGSNFPILVKMNCNDNIEGGIDINNFPEIVQEVANTGIDAIEISGNNPFRFSTDDLQVTPTSDHPVRINLEEVDYQSFFYEYAKKLDLDIPVILTGGNQSIEHMEKIVREGKVDFFGLARPLIAETDLPNRWLKGMGKEGCNCIACSQCFGQLMQGKPAVCQVF